ncbi:MAG: PHP domain-containing protein [Lentisphaerae bacterium]|nr:PHP domain-containing protein [Lentisphaerota bacterium]
MPSETVKIDLHCHSVFSDGALTPHQVARHCAGQGVRFAALTDHNTTDGLDAFESGCERHAIGFISGLELSAIHGYREIHLLCYGFDRKDSELTRVLAALKGSRALNNSVYAAGDMKTSRKIIETIHQAGGIVLLAHPWATEPDSAKLENLVKELRALGLDGIEVWNTEATPEQQEFLRALAAREKCVSSGGTDHHGVLGVNPGVDMPTVAWQAFRDHLTHQRKNVSRNRSARQQSERSPDSGNGPGKVKILIPLVLPALAAIVLFAIALFGYFLPRFEEALLERKRETIMELTRTVWSSYFHGFCR